MTNPTLTPRKHDERCEAVLGWLSHHCSCALRSERAEAHGIIAEQTRLANEEMDRHKHELAEVKEELEAANRNFWIEHECLKLAEQQLEQCYISLALEGIRPNSVNEGIEQLRQRLVEAEKDAGRYRYIAACPRERASLEWLEADEIDAHIDAQQEK